MRRRVADGVPPVTEAEFGELADWFDANRERLYGLSLPSQLLDLGDGLVTSTANVRYELARGPRAYRAGEVAEKVRCLKTLYGEGRP